MRDAIRPITRVNKALKDKVTSVVLVQYFNELRHQHFPPFSLSPSSPSSSSSSPLLHSHGMLWPHCCDRKSLFFQGRRSINPRIRCEGDDNGDAEDEDIDKIMR